MTNQAPGHLIQNLTFVYIKFIINSALLSLLLYNPGYNKHNWLFKSVYCLNVSGFYIIMMIDAGDMIEL